jgi:enediyne biosynthesis protein E4
VLVYRNEVSPDNQWVQFELEGAASNRSAIGAQVRVFWDGRQQLQEVHAGTGFSSQNPMRLHFGLGKSPKVGKVVIRWPSGREQTLTTIELNKLHRIEEPLAHAA